MYTSTTDIPNLAFLPDGSYDLSTPECVIAACEAALYHIANTIPMSYYGRGPEFVRDQMTGCAQKLVDQLRLARKPADGVMPHATARRIGDAGEVRCGDLMGPHDGVRLCGDCSTISPDERTIPCGDLIERLRDLAPRTARGGMVCCERTGDLLLNVQGDLHDHRDDHYHRHRVRLRRAVRHRL